MTTEHKQKKRLHFVCYKASAKRLKTSTTRLKKATS